MKKKNVTHTATTSCITNKTQNYNYKKGFTVKINFNEGLEEKGFKETAKYLAKGTIGKSIAVLMAGTLMAGCQSTQNEYDQALANYQGETNSRVSAIDTESLSDISEGKSGVYSSDEDGIVFISNYDSNEPLSKQDESALSNVVSDRILNHTHSFYTESDKSGLSKAKNNQPSVHYIHIEKDAFETASNTLGMHENTDMIKEYGNKFVVMHELGHFYTTKYITHGHDSFSKTQKREVSADIIASSLLAKVNDMSHPEFNKLIDQMKDLRSKSAFRTGKLDHYTNQGLTSVQEIYNDNPELYEAMKKMSIKEITNISITVSSSLSDEINLEIKNSMFETARANIEQDYASYVKDGALTDDSYLKQYFDGKGDGLKLQLYYLNLAQENQAQHPEYSTEILDTIAKNIVKLESSSYITDNITPSSDISVKVRDHIERIAYQDDVIAQKENASQKQSMSI